MTRLHTLLPPVSLSLLLHVRGHSTDLSGHSFQVHVRQEQRWTEVDHPSRLLAADALLSLSKPRASLPTPRATTHLLRGTVRLLDFLACRQRRVMTEPIDREPHHYLPSYSYSPWIVRPSERRWESCMEAISLPPAPTPCKCMKSHCCVLSRVGRVLLTKEARLSPVETGQGARGRGRRRSPHCLSLCACVEDSRCLASVEASARARSQSRTVRRTQPHIHATVSPASPHSQSATIAKSFSNRASRPETPVGRRAASSVNKA